MADQAASIGVKMDTSDVERGIKTLDQLSATGAKVEQAMGKVGAGARNAVTNSSELKQAMGQLTAQEEKYIKALYDEAKVLGMSRGEKAAYIAQTKGMGVAAQEVARAIGNKVDAIEKEKAAVGSLASTYSAAMTAVRGFLALQVVGWSKNAASAIYEASAAADRLRTGLDFSSARGSADEISYLRKTTHDLGLELGTTAAAYMQFQAAAKGTSLEGQKARAVFESVAKASAVMGLSAEKSNGVLLALQQMVSKGTVQAEELRGQLGERLPGAFQIAARAMGVTTAELGKMLEMGQVISEDFLPKFATELQKSLGDSAEKAANRLDAATNRFNNAWDRLKQNVGDSGVSAAMADGFGSAAGSLDAISVAMESARLQGDGFWGQMGAAVGVMHDLTMQTDRMRVNMHDNAKATAEAEKELDKLQRLAAAQGTSAWLLKEIGNVRRYIGELQQARREKEALTGISVAAAENPRDAEAGNSRGNQVGYYKALNASLQQLAADDDKITKQFTDRIEAYGKALASGAIDADKYREKITLLNKERYASTDAGKAEAAAMRDASKASKGAGKIDSAQTKSAVSEIQSSLRDLTSSYSVAESIMEARRSAGLLDEKEYYDAKKSFIELNKQAQVSALKEEAAALQSQQLNGAEAIARDQKVAELKAKVTQLSIDAAGKLEVLEIQQAAAANQHASALLAAKQAADEYILSIQRASAVEVLGIGRGDRWRQDETGRLGVQDKFADQRRTLANQRTQQEMAGPLSPEAVSRYEQSLAQINAAEREALAVYQDGVAQRVAAESDWSNGAIRAMENYRDTSANVAAQTANAFSSAFQGMEDALVSFAMTGKADFKSLANSIIADLLRVQARAAISGIFSNILGSVAGSIGGGSTTGGGNAAQGLKLNALGGVYESPSLSAYSNQVHSTPKLFAFAKGAGVFGEAGPEAIMPLTRAPDGNLGVRAMGGGGAINLTLSPVITIDSRSDRADVEAQIASGMKIAADYAQQQLLYKMNRGMV